MAQGTLLCVLKTPSVPRENRKQENPSCVPNGSGSFTGLSPADANRGQGPQPPPQALGCLQEAPVHGQGPCIRGLLIDPELKV